jgi:uncharacterized protein YgiM (DUF1202 family)
MQQMRYVGFLCLAMAVNSFAGIAPAVIHRPVMHMLSRPAADADVVSQAIFGTNVQVLERQPAWFKIRTPDDYTGWIEASGALARDSYAAAGTVATVTS